MKLLLATVAYSAACWGAADWKTATPIIYNIDYKKAHVGSPEYLKKIAEAPPELLHVGEDVPFSSVYGTKEGYAGDKAKLLTVEEARAKIAELKKYVGDLHRAGVRWVIPYINNKAVIGNHVKRLGYWEFFDHWERFREFGFGPQPPEDMVLAQMQSPFRRLRTARKEMVPYLIYEMCDNNPNWRRYLLAVTANIARCGYDGVFVDEMSLHDYCTHCREKFRTWVGQKYSPAERRRRFGRAGLGSLSLGYAGEGALWHDTLSFWAASNADLLRDVRDEGRKVKPDFFVVPNYGPLAHFPGVSNRVAGGKDPAAWAPYCRVMMFEEKHRPGRLPDGTIIDYRLQYKMSFALGVRAGILSYMAQEPAGIELAMAEAGAGGGGGLIQPYHNAPESRKKYGKFFSEHRDLFEGFDSHADVGVLFAFDQIYWGNSSHLQSIYRLAEYLSNRHVLFDLVSPGEATSARLRRYRAVITPNVKYLPDGVLAELRTYAAGGGVWLDIGHSGEFDEDGYVRPRPEKEPASEPLGEGRILRRAELDEVVRYPRFALYLIPEDDDITNMNEVAAVLESIQAGQQVFPHSLYREDLCAVLEAAVGRPLSVVAGKDLEGLRANAYRKRSGDESTLMVHLVNYNCPIPMKATLALGVKAPVPKGTFDAGQPAAELAPKAIAGASVRLAPGGKVTSVRAFDPDVAEVVVVPFTQNGDRLELTLPALRLYKILEIKISRR